jgi:hypothetical protein
LLVAVILPACLQSAASLRGSPAGREPGADLIG